MPDATTPVPEPASEPMAIAQSVLAGLLSWVWPGMGHLYLRRWSRGILFMVLIGTCLLIGCTLDGRLDTVINGQPLSMLRTIGAMGLGLPYFILRWLVGYQGEIVAAGFEYGSAFTLTAGLMNWLLVLDCWDIASGRKD